MINLITSIIIVVVVSYYFKWDTYQFVTATCLYALVLDNIGKKND